MRPGAPALCPGVVLHRRRQPRHHEFRQRVSMVWIDPDDPGALFDGHLLWSSSRPAPVRFRRSDHGLPDAPVGGAAVRGALEAATGHRPEGAVRLLTQPRRAGWLFNPISIYLAWQDDDRPPVGLVAEVTNTPWKERRRYAVPLRMSDSGCEGSFDKELHVSPFIDTNCTYDARVAIDDHSVSVDIDVRQPGPGLVLETRLVVDRVPATSRSMTRFAVQRPFSNHLVSAGIHVQAARLWAKRVPFVPHPRADSQGCPMASHRESA